MPQLILLFGILLVLLLGVTLYLAKKANGRMQQIEAMAAQQRLVEEERDRFFTLSLDLLSITDADGNFRQLNDAWTTTLGYSLKEVKTKKLLDLVHPDDREHSSAEFTKLVSGRDVFACECRFVCRDGSHRWLLWAARRSPQTGLIYAVAKDITDRRHTEEKLAISARELERKNRELALALASAHEAMNMKSRFVATIGHEIRTPMSGILGMNELLLCTNLDSEQRHFALSVKQSTESLLQIVNDILDFSKIEAGRLEIEQKPFDLHVSLHTIVNLFLPQAVSKDLTLETEIDPATPAKLVGDAGRLRQVLVNLLSNAIKFTERGMVRLRVETIQQEHDCCQVQFSVEDTGIGIPDKQLDHVFQEYVQVETASARRFEGTGLGLPIAKRLVEMMGGTIECRSDVGLGTTFSFALPFTIGEGDQEPVNPPAATTESAPRQCRTLVVEDNRVNRTVAVRMLSKLGCDVEAVSGGEEAIDLLDRQPFHLVLMDVNMPGIDGLETTRRIRRRERPGHRVPIIAMTARAMDGDREQCLTAGMDDYLSKPVSVAILQQLLARWLPAAAERRVP